MLPDGATAVLVDARAGVEAGHDLADAFPHQRRPTAFCGALLDPEVTDSVLEWMRGGGQLNSDPLTRLSEQERKILPLIALGKTNRQIGEMLYLSEHTVKSYVSSLLKKLELARRSEAAAYVARHEHVPVA